jgi:hypothetical protein
MHVHFVLLAIPMFVSRHMLVVVYCFYSSFTLLVGTARVSAKLQAESAKNGAAESMPVASVPVDQQNGGDAAWQAVVAECFKAAAEESIVTDAVRRASDISQTNAANQDVSRKVSLPAKPDAPPNSIAAKKQPPAPPVRRVGFGNSTQQSSEIASAMAPSALDVLLLKQMVGGKNGGEMAAAESTEKKSEAVVESDITPHKKVGFAGSEDDSSTSTTHVGGDTTDSPSRNNRAGSTKVGPRFDTNITEPSHSASTIFVSSAPHPPENQPTPRRDPRAEHIAQLQKKLEIETKVQFVCAQTASVLHCFLVQNEIQNVLICLTGKVGSRTAG